MTDHLPLTGTEFLRRFRWLIVFTWSIPPIVGLGFIVLIGVLTPAQIVAIMTTPLEPAYIIGWLAFSVWYLPRRMRPVADWLDGLPHGSFVQAVQAIRAFPLTYWAALLTYLVIAPVSVILAAEIYADFVATPVDYFRIELIALIVSIVVGLPIFFLVFDLFGQALGREALRRPILTIRAKVFLIGALVPLLIDTLLVQYYWTRTGFFSFETFVVWLMLELLAVAGSLIFVRSFGQALAPLQAFIGADRAQPAANIANLRARSTDELGALTGDYRRLLARLQLHSDVLDVNNQLLRRTGDAVGVETAFAAIVDLCREAVGCDKAFLIVHDPATYDLVGVAQTGDGYRADGHFRFSRDDKSLAVCAFENRQTVTVDDAANDPRISAWMRERFGVRSSLATPVWLEGRAHGVLMVIDRRPRRYGEREVALLEGLAREAALILHTRRLRQASERSDAERREQSELIRLLMDATEQGIFGVDTRGTCTFINRAALRMLGYQRPEDLLGCVIHDRIHHTYPDGRPCPKEDCSVRRATLAGLAAHADDEVHWRADGTTFPVECWSHPLYRDGKLAGAVVTFIDITERKRTDRALSEAVRDFEDLLGASPVGVFEADAAGAVTFVSERWTKITGLPADRAYGNGWKDAVHPDARDAVFSQWQDAVRAQRSLQLEFRLQRDDDVQTWVLEQSLPRRTADGRVNGFIGTLTDVTHMKNTESALRQSEARHRALFDTMVVGVVYQAADGRIEAANPAAERILGLTVDQMQGRTSMDPRWRAIREDGSPFPGNEHPAMVALRTGQPVRDVVMGVFHPQDAAYRWISINAIPEFERGAAAPSRVYTTFVDITERQQFEEWIRQINAELETRVVERTAELLAARNSAEAANRAKSNFLSQMSHELRTPLNAILGFAQVLRIGGGTTATTRSLQHVEQIEKAGRHLLELINDLLDLSRIESGNMVVGREPVELQQLCTECARLVKPVADAVAIAVIDKTAEAAPLVAWGDRTRLTQVLMNILSNAVKYNREGGTVTLTLRAIDDQWVEIAVADSGPGFTEEQLRSLYQPFNRLGAERGRTEGTGIGLVISKRLIELMGGSIDVATQRGEGSRFTLRLARALPAALSASTPHARAHTTSATPTRGFTVLYVEDDPLNIELVKATLALRPGVKFVAAPDGPTGLAMAEAQHPDLIVVDIGLPGIDGHEVCRRLRARADTARKRIIALTANAMPADIERGRAAGFDAYLTKPLDVEMFLAQVDDAIEARPTVGA